MRSHATKIDLKVARDILKKITHKEIDDNGISGSALLIGGSYGMIGSMVLSSKACVRSGAGKTSAFVPQFGYEILQIANPEVLVLTDSTAKTLSSLPDLDSYDAYSIGNGMGEDEKTQKMFYNFITYTSKPTVIDSDALNILAQKPDWLTVLPENTILTPHPKEFSNMLGTNKLDREYLIEQQKRVSKAYGVIMLLKGAKPTIATPDGTFYECTVGNGGLVTSGTGDVLTGLITGLLVQGLTPKEAAILGVYLYGAAGDSAAKKYGQRAMIASDVVDNIGEAFKSLEK